MVNAHPPDSRDLSPTVAVVSSSSESPANVVTANTIADVSPPSGAKVVKPLLHKQIKKINASRPPLPRSDKRSTKKYRNKLAKALVSLSGVSLITLMCLSFRSTHNHQAR
ncbi:hypothetical protein V6N11_067337 [Hibiscus sabdariffa]|uniref:Uncharacterized protein n=1 Tax=Hibiscus sabdariffa TaxID=183260 RepID=A0ABR2SRA2_9ROSI